MRRVILFQTRRALRSSARELIEMLDRVDNVLLCRARIDRAQTQRRNIAQLGRSQQRELLFHRKIDKLALNVIVLPEAKTNGRHLRGRKNFPTFARAQLALSELGQLEPARNRLAKCSDAERLERQPNFERAKTSR